MRPINNCPDCGATTQRAVPDGDSRERDVCTSCSIIHYQNPKVVAGVVPVWEDRILLCRRAIEPRYGAWTLPAGFMENGESVEQCAARETWEEALAEVHRMRLYTIHSVPRFSQVYMMFRANLLSEDGFGVGEESLETALFKEHEIPWDEISFPMIRRTLECFFADRSTGKFGLYVEDIV